MLQQMMMYICFTLSLFSSFPHGSQWSAVLVAVGPGGDAVFFPRTWADLEIWLPGEEVADGWQGIFTHNALVKL